MKTIVLILFVFFCSLTVLNAQSKMNVGLRAVVALPIGSFGDVVGTGFGAQGTYEIGFGKNLVGVGKIGYISWGGKDVGDYSYSYSAVPVVLGVKYFFTPGSGLYATSSVGFHFFSVSTDVPTIAFGGVTIEGGSASASSTDFTFILGAGYQVPLNQKFALDIGGDFNLISDSNYLTIHVGGNMGL
jgi:hypothetical protein